MNDNFAVESFIEYCDSMMIATETKSFKFKLDSPDFLQNFKVSIEDLEEHVLPLHGKITKDNLRHVKKRNPKVKKTFDSYYRSDLNKNPKSICTMIEKAVLYKRDYIKSKINSSHSNITRIEFAVPFKNNIGFVVINGIADPAHRLPASWLHVILEVSFNAAEICLVNAFPITEKAAKLIGK